MPFVASPQQIRTFRQRVSNPSYSQEAISVEFITTRDFIASVLPPTLKPAELSTGIISVSSWESNVCGSFSLSSISVRCTCDGLEGYWVLHLIVDESFAITWGRETWGEVKKQGMVKLSSHERKKSGYMERDGLRLIEIEAEFDASFCQQSPADGMEWFDFEVKAFPNSLGTGLHTAPQLIVLQVTDDYTVHLTGSGRLTLRGTESDPLHDIPIASVGTFTYCRGPSRWCVVGERALCPPEEYFPYFVARHYDNVADFPVGKGMSCICDMNRIEGEGKGGKGDNASALRSWTST
ncbi:hypothetical protein ASPVEDRAFT_328208 [Aspergillus versicolor CBS 583.65]|uniref:Uncharacterized protein n=1 Tax=Aspergillus versicolor CBS 583.65 TaxID=1036611 RepID=A0A1L9PYJ7_ASPVE|nr:uncharacterized protein ASPVEDRAFT_328208 [Aspergillus versicolor CBS 583.65]OJJ06543.1 hypothetical protein ASPVEDRAFT_328208 [Aspergillus versicolor CBS 583.65]